MYTVNQVLLKAFEFEKSIELQIMEFYFGEMANVAIINEFKI